MTDKELKRMSRGELLELLVFQMEENEKLREQLKDAERELTNRRITISEAGSIAEASLQLNGVFRAAEEAAQQYLENVRCLEKETKRKKVKKVRRVKKVKKKDIFDEIDLSLFEAEDLYDIDLSEFEAEDL